ncbi:MAG: pilus assembly protein N-terminal domain-containing protein [Planctomycetota bacterium]|nr:pilus assembly protein N-terminal domain-containing protein [Planctomycetota bacterium]
MLSRLFRCRPIGTKWLQGILAVGLLAPGSGLTSAQDAPVLNLPPAAAAAAAPASPLESKVADLVDEIVQQEIEMDVAYRRSKILRMKQPIFRAAIADPSIIEIVAFGTREIEIIGKETGSTTVTFWLGDEDNPRHLSMVVNVQKDDGVDDRRRLEYGELQLMINEMFPNSRIQLIPIADKLIVRGQARDEQESAQIMSLLRKNSTPASGPFGGQGSASQGTAAEPFPDAGTLPAAEVISLLKVPGEKQVMLKVRIAELKRSAVRRLGTDFNLDIGDLMVNSALAGGGNILATGMFDDDSFSIALTALTGNGSAKILAEPNLVVLSGQTANFISGGQFAVPTVVGVGGAQAASTSFKGFGTQLSFSPLVLDHDRIRLSVSPTFSTLNRNNAVNGVFGLDTRSVNTTVEMREGQVLALAGLLQDQQASESTRIPFLGETKLLRPLFESKSVSRDETELLILVTPELVHPMEPGDVPCILPGMEVTEPDDVDFFIYGDIEGRPGFQHRSTVWPLFRDRYCRCKDEFETLKRSQQFYMQGQHGFSN